LRASCLLFANKPAKCFSKNTQLVSLPSTVEKRSLHQLDGLTVRVDMYVQ
jgi:hypothetical protein